MNPIDDQLNRLFRAAAQVRSSEVAPVPYGLETRSLAAWRASRTVDAGAWDLPLLVRGLVVACVIMAVSFVPALSSTSTSTTTASSTNPFADFLQLTDSTVPSDEAP
jgi:hypothetical protein